MKKMKWLCLMICGLFVFSSCSQLKVEGQQVATAPALQLLQMPPYEDEDDASAGSGAADGHMMVDLWLDASQLAGGINEDKTSLYPQYAKRYRQGGFHYRLGKTEVGLYESVLTCLLEATDGARVRLLRVGNERLPKSLLESYGFTGNAAQMRSYRRDLLTYAVNPMPSIFSGFSSESMEDSFYSLGSPQMNQMSRFAASNGEELENPGMVDKMDALLTGVVASFHQKDVPAPKNLNASKTDEDCPLLYALSNLDTSRLSVITCDPATFRKLQDTNLDGSPIGYVEQKLRDRKIFDKGLCVGLYAMQLDYMGHMVSFGAADFSDSLIWGKPEFVKKTQKVEGVFPMPRIMLVLVIGQKEQVEQYTASLNRQLDQNAALKQLRGPDDGQLTYTANSATVVQQPFQFFYEYTSVSRPSLGYYTQSAEGGTLNAQSGATSVEKDGLSMITLDGKKADTLVYSWPAEKLPEGMQLDFSSLSQTRVVVTDSLLLTEILPNTPENQEQEDGVQRLVLRDKVYCFARVENPFEGKEKSSPFTLRSIGLNEDGTRLEAKVDVDHSKLGSGYYRVQIVADVTGEQLEWPVVPFAQNGTGLSVEISDSEIIRWQTLMNTITRYARAANSIPSPFTHAWGSYTGKTYKDVEIPDFPPVYKALWLSRLLEQMQSAANLESAPLIRCTFDVFVPEIIEP